jgi:hypothetical protein
VTKNARHRALGSSRLAAARNARSAGRSAGRDTCRRRRASSWRSTTISSSLNSGGRKHRHTRAITRPAIKYKNDGNTSPSHRQQSQRHYELAAIKTPTPPAHGRVLAPHRPSELVSTDRELMAQDKDLELLALARAQPQGKQPQRLACHPVDERQDQVSPPQIGSTEHGRLPALWLRVAPGRARNRVFDPTV